MATEWLRGIVPDNFLRELSIQSKYPGRATQQNLCIICRGSRMLCGRWRCPVLIRAQSLAKVKPLITSAYIFGSSPPAVFVGRIGYPRVSVGPMVPPFRGDTEILDTPEAWGDKTVQEIVDFRYSLIRGKVTADVYEAVNGGKNIEALQELAMGKHPVDAEVVLEKIPLPRLIFSDDVQPFGPSAPLKSFSATNIKADPRIERAFYDKDLKAADAVLELYNSGTMVSKIQKAFSLGMFGDGSRRRLVPTRWSITAVDSIISQRLIDEIKQFPSINEFRVYTFQRMNNLFVAILMPENWRFEWIEAWFPNTTWNQRSATSPAVMGDWEPYQGRTTYPEIGGCYYACRLAVAEKLREEKRQAGALVIREIHPGFILPLGVWFTRESVRAMLRPPPSTFPTFREALNYAVQKLTLPLERWVSASRLIREEIAQKKILEFM
ncbi:MAG: Nre family DNA repair protein [Candidatus Hadarchaeales archaeon]